MINGLHYCKVYYSFIFISFIMLLSTEAGSEPIDGGFFFYDDKYIEAPYVVERRGLEVFINGIKVDFISEPFDWRILDDPGLPPIDSEPPSNTPWPGTEHYDEYWGRKYRYLCATNEDREQANAKFMDVIKNMPGIMQIKEDPGDKYRKIIHYSSGKTQIFNFRSDDTIGNPFPSIPSKEELTEKAEKKRERFERKLKNNEGFFDRSRGGCMELGSTAALRLVEILLSNESPEERAKALGATSGFERLLTDPWKSQLDSIQSNEQLATRAKRIRTELEKKKQTKEILVISNESVDWAADSVLDNSDYTTGQEPKTQEPAVKPLTSNDKQGSTVTLSTAASRPIESPGFPTLWFVVGISIVAAATGVVLILRFRNRNHIE